MSFSFEETAVHALTSSPLARQVGRSGSNQIQEDEEMASGKRKRREKGEEEEEEEELWTWCPLERDLQQVGGNNNQLQSVYFRLLTLKMWEGKTRSERYMKKRWIPDHLDWYTIDSNTGSSSTAPSLTVNSKMLRVPRSSTSVTMGSKIYVLGGYSPSTFGLGLLDTPNLFLDTVFYCDINNRKKGWKKGPSMLVKRRDPYAVPVDGKLYVFGGNEPLHDEGCCLSVEVFDPHLNKWELLPSYSCPPLSRCNVAPLHALLLDSCGRKHLLLNVIQRRALYTYSLDANTWKLFDPDFGFYNRQHLAVLDGFIYCYKPSTDFYQGFKVFAYDIIGRKWFDKHVEGLGEDNIPHPYPPGHLFHVGNDKLCLVTKLDMQFEELSVEVSCTVFTVRRQRSADGEEPTLHAHVESTTCYRARGHEFIDCLAL